MAPLTKKAKKEASEKELEGFLFGDSNDDVWAKTGHELDQTESKKEDQEDEEETEETEQTFFFDSGPVSYTLDAPVELDHQSDSEIDYEAEEGTDADANSESDDDDESDSESKLDGKAAWEDEDDKRIQISLSASNITKKLRNDVDEDIVDGVEYSRRLRRQFNKIYPKPEWATLPSEIKADRKRKAMESDDEDNKDNDDEEEQLDEETRLDLLKSTMGILARRTRKTALPSNRLDILRIKNANRAAPKNHTQITAIAFHPNAQIMLTAGMDKTLRLFQIDGKINPKIQSVVFKDMPIYHAEFHPSGNQIVVSGRRQFFYIYDIQSGIIDRCPGIWGKEEKSLERFSISPCGRYIAFLGKHGVIIIVSYLTKQWFCDLIVNKVVESVDWSADGEFIFGFSSEGEVFQFDIQKKACVKRWIDDGCIGASVIKVSPNENYYATGSSTGVVNLYDRSVLDPKIIRPKPIKAFMNLTTRINNILFNHDSKLMVVSSHSKQDQLKVIHVPTATTFSNWPTDRTPLGKVGRLAFSPNSDYLAVANDKGAVLLYTLKHYALQ
ncbi:WD40-repeat-containing domain protein [Mucor mucedo]|uniref:WD40-repeat-containing domain protein n=1 Tax=Mucor mucedo TaxID=29922 RepID=UPI00221FA8FC|nr:WD40-repeat-containing domain protein [Mucor mucedo]KAI7881234.1 WD40-repeat-containing domain protein [Mucor mucedo]